MHVYNATTPRGGTEADGAAAGAKGGSFAGGNDDESSTARLDEVERLRADLTAALADGGGSYVAANFAPIIVADAPESTELPVSRANGGGHWSPLAAYAPSADAVLVLDVARCVVARRARRPRAFPHSLTPSISRHPPPRPPSISRHPPPRPPPFPATRTRTPFSRRPQTQPPPLPPSARRAATADG